jgi:ABC-type glycerol-3-phosphate transport system substrate-binding protein
VKKFLLLLMVVITAVSMLVVGASCKGGTSVETTAAAETTVAETTAADTSAAETSAEEREPVTLTIWTPQGTDEGVYKMYAEDGEWSKNLKEKYNITLKVEHKAMDAWWEVLTTAAMSQTGPDIIFNWTGFQYIIDAGRNKVVKPINDMVSQELLDSVVGWDGVTDTDGQIYGIPYCVSTQGLAMNKTLFDKAGIDLSDHPKIVNWDEFSGYCDKLLAAGITPIAFANKEGYMGEWWIGDYGTTYFDSNAELLTYIQEKSMNSQPFQAMSEKFKEMYDKGYFFDGGNTLDYGTNAFPQFEGGKAAMQATWGSTYPGYVKAIGEGNVIVTDWPNFGDGKLSQGPCGLYGSVFGVTNWTKYSEEAFLAIQELVTTDWGSDVVWNVAGEIPSNKSWEFTPSALGEDWDNYVKFYLDSFKNTDIEAGGALAYKWSAEFGQTFYKFNGAYISGDITFEEFAKELDAARGIE